MAKPEWGLKRTCQSCGLKFYDMTRSPILCPSCGATFDPDRVTRARRGTPPAKPSPKPKPAPEDVDGIETAPVNDDTDEEIIEDASDLGDDNGDMAEVIDNLDDGLKDKE